MGDRGFAFPLRVNARGGIEASAGVRKVREAILVLLGTRPGERLMRPGYGCELQSLVFAPCNPATANLARFFVIDAIARWEPRAAVEEVAVFPVEPGGRVRFGYPPTGGPDGPGLFIDVRYRLVETGEPAEVVFAVPLA